MRAHMLWAVTALVICYVRHALQYRRPPWAEGWIMFAESWFFHALGVCGVAFVVYVASDSSQAFFAKDRIARNPSEMLFNLKAVLERLKIHDLLVTVCLTLMVATLAIGFFALMIQSGAEFGGSDDW